MQVDLHGVSTPEMLSIILKSILKSGFFKLQQGKRKLPSFDEREVRTEKTPKVRNISQSVRLVIVHRSQYSIVKKRVTVWIY